MSGYNPRTQGTLSYLLLSTVKTIKSSKSRPRSPSPPQPGHPYPSPPLLLQLGKHPRKVRQPPHLSLYTPHFIPQTDELPQSCFTPCQLCSKTCSSSAAQRESQPTGLPLVTSKNTPDSHLYTSAHTAPSWRRHPSASVPLAAFLTSSTLVLCPYVCLTTPCHISSYMKKCLLPDG